jgi:hypothetical protein
MSRTMTVSFAFLEDSDADDEDPFSFGVGWFTGMYRVRRPQNHLLLCMHLSSLCSRMYALFFPSRFIFGMSLVYVCT